jgi:hypothetical protein
MVVGYRRVLENVIIVITFSFQCSGFVFIGNKHSIFSENIRGSIRIRACQHMHRPDRPHGILGLGMVEKSDTGLFYPQDRLMMNSYSGANPFQQRRSLLQSAIAIATLGLVVPGSAVGEGLASRLRCFLFMPFIDMIISSEFFLLLRLSARSIEALARPILPSIVALPVK